MAPLVNAGLLQQFATSPSIQDRWTAARQMMASRELLSVLDSTEFQTGFSAIARQSAELQGIDRLVAIDLVVRLSSFAKKLKLKAQRVLGDALRAELPPLALIADAKSLPAEAKPAEIRENIALALSCASGDWLVPYVVRALAEEDRSQRCRLELTRQLAARETSVELWLRWLSEQPAIARLSGGPAADSAVSRLRDIAAALANIMQRIRVKLTVSMAAGKELSRLCNKMVSVSPHLPLPKRLEEAAAEVTRVLDEMLSARLTLIVEPDVYAVIADFDRWWRPLPYPKILNTALEPVVDKLVSGITLRALMGQRSDMLSARLRQAVGDAKEAQKRLALIADAEVGLTPDTQDWLHGNIRTESSTSEIAANTLQSVATQDILASIATLLLDAHEISSEAASNSEITHHLARMLNRIKSIAAEQGLEVAGRTGEIVEFSPAAHETGGAGPAETRVRIVRPMIVRQRRDGGRDILLKALVAEI